MSKRPARNVKRVNASTIKTDRRIPERWLPSSLCIWLVTFRSTRGQFRNARSGKCGLKILTRRNPGNATSLDLRRAYGVDNRLCLPAERWESGCFYILFICCYSIDPKLELSKELSCVSHLPISALFQMGFSSRLSIQC